MPRIRWWIFAISSLSLAPRDAAAICREVTETGSSPPVIKTDQEILVIKRSGVPVGCEPPTPGGDAGAGGDGGPAPGDAGAPKPDAGDTPGDAGAADGGALDAGSCQPRLADTVTWVVQPRFSIGPDGSRFALLMVTPRAPVIETAPESTFEDLAATTAPLVTVEERYVEDASLGYQCNDPKYGGGGCDSISTSGGTGEWTPPDPSDEGAADAATLDGYVRVETVGSYQVVVLSAADGDELAAWLDGAGYAHAPEDIDALRPYLAAGWIVTAVRVRSATAVDAGGLEPLSFTFEGSELRLPLGVARQPVGNRALLKIYIAAEGRYEVPGAALSFAGWTGDDAATFLTASLLDADLSRPAEEDPVAIRAAADTEFQDSYTRVKEIRIPSSSCPSNDSDEIDLCDCRAGAGAGGQAANILLAAACAAVVLRRRKRRR